MGEGLRFLEVEIQGSGLRVWASGLQVGALYLVFSVQSSRPICVLATHLRKYFGLRASFEYVHVRLFAFLRGVVYVCE